MGKRGGADEDEDDNDDKFFSHAQPFSTDEFIVQSEYDPPNYVSIYICGQLAVMVISSCPSPSLCSAISFYWHSELNLTALFSLLNFDLTEMIF